MTHEPYPPAPPEPAHGAGMQPFAPLPPEPFEVAPTAVARTSGGRRGLTLALAVAVLVAASGVAFAMGRATAPVQAASAGTAPGTAAQGGAGANGGAAGGPPNASFDPNGTNGSNGGQGRTDDNGGEGGGGVGGRFGFGGGPSIQGTVQSVTPASVTIKLAGGQTVTVGLGPATTYHQQAAGSQSDVAPGKTVILKVNGRVRPDGTATGTPPATASDVTVVP